MRYSRISFITLTDDLETRVHNMRSGQCQHRLLRDRVIRAILRLKVHCVQEAADFVKIVGEISCETM